MRFISATAFLCFILPLSGLGNLVSAQEAEDLIIGPISEGPTLSPDNFRIAFSSNAGSGSDDYNIWLMDEDGTNLQILTPFSGSDEKQPDWLADSGSVVFSSNKGNSLFNIWIISVDGLVITQLTASSGNNTHPRVSPDGTKIIFLSDRTGKRELWIMNVDGTEQKPVALMSLRVADPTWAPDNVKIAFVGCKELTCNLFQINKNGHETSQITSGTFQDWTPDWGPQGIVFSSNRDPSQGIWIVQPDGSGLQLLDINMSASLDPRWTSGGGVVFSRYVPEDEQQSGQIWQRNSFGEVTQLTDTDSFSLDKDGDGIKDTKDNCPLTKPGEIVDPANGCSIAQLCPCEGPRGTSSAWGNHGKYVSCIAKTSKSFVKKSLITEKERSVIVSEAASSACGK